MSRSGKRRDQRMAEAKRGAALARDELRGPPKPAPVPREEIDRAIAEGRITKLPPGKRTRR